MATKPFDWNNLNEVLQASFDRALDDSSLRWVAIGNAPSVGHAIRFARLLKPKYCSRLLIGESKVGIAVWIDALSLELESTDA